MILKFFVLPDSHKTFLTGRTISLKEKWKEKKMRKSRPLKASPNGKESWKRCLKSTDKWPFNQSMKQSIHRWIDQSIDQSIVQSINQSINETINKSIEQSINESINPSINWSMTNQSIHQPVNQSMKQSINRLIKVRRDASAKLS